MSDWSGVHTGIAKCRCPYCDEPIQLVIDPMQIDSQYVEDCEVCCRPMVVTRDHHRTTTDLSLIHI